MKCIKYCAVERCMWRLTVIMHPPLLSGLVVLEGLGLATSVSQHPQKHPLLCGTVALFQLYTPADDKMQVEGK